MEEKKIVSEVDMGELAAEMTGRFSGAFYKVTRVKPFKARILDLKTLAISPEFTITGASIASFSTSEGELRRDGVFDALHTRDIESQLSKVQKALVPLKAAYEELINALKRASFKLEPITETEEAPALEKPNQQDCESTAEPAPSQEQTEEPDQAGTEQEHGVFILTTKKGEN